VSSRSFHWLKVCPDWGDRSGTFNDPYGYRWSIATRKEDLTPQEMEKRQNEWMKQFAPQPVHS